MLNQAVVALEIIGNHLNAGAYIGIAHIDNIGAQSTYNLNLGTRRCTEHKELIIALQTIDYQLLNAVITGESPGTINAFVSNHIIIGKLGTYYGQRIETIATGNPHRGIDRIRDVIGTRTTVNIGYRRKGVVGVYQDKRTYQEIIAVSTALQLERGLIAQYSKAIIAIATNQRRVGANTVGQITLSGKNSVKLIVNLQPSL